MITTSEHDGITVVMMDRGAVNALDIELVGALTSTLEELGQAGRPVVLTGAGGCFSAGVDLRRAQEGPTYLRGFLPALTRAFLAVFDYPGPLVAAINGHALAGGYVIAAAADWRVMADGKGDVGLTEVRVGVPFPAAALEIVRFAVGDAACRDLVLTGRRVGATTAASERLVDEVVAVDQLLGCALTRAREFGEVPTATYRLTKQQLHHRADAAIARLTAEFERKVGDIWTSEEAADAFSSYMKAPTARRWDGR